MNRPVFDETIDERVAGLLRESAEWSLIGLLFAPPSAEQLAQVRELAAEVDDPGLKEAAELAHAEADPGLYHTTFGPGGPAQPREVSYRETVHPGRYLGELSSLYEAFAYRPDTEEPPDHVSVEAGFIGYLRMKEAFARFRGHDEEAAISAGAAQCFIEEHLAMLAEPLAESLKNSGIPYLALAAAALVTRVGPRPGHAPETATEKELSDTLTCGGIES